MNVSDAEIGLPSGTVWKSTSTGAEAFQLNTISSPVFRRNLYSTNWSGMSPNSMASTLYVVADGVSGPPGFGAIGGPPGCPPTGFNGCWVWARPVTTRPSGSNPEAASSETVTIDDCNILISAL